MSEAKTFEGKSIDDAIQLACEHFDADREQLEIDIISDSKGGIFGLVGAKKAQVKARLRDNSRELIALVSEVVQRLISCIVDETDLDISMEPSGRVNVSIKDDEHSGLLIGREGQTLSAIQYLANRIVAKRWPDPVRIQLDTGDYRDRQDDNLRQLALHLADKAKNQNRVQSTKPLSSYHRRVVHMALQSDDTISTRSKGDGPLKRVLILPKRGGRGRQQHQRNSG